MFWFPLMPSQEENSHYVNEGAIMSENVEVGFRTHVHSRNTKDKCFIKNKKVLCYLIIILCIDVPVSALIYTYMQVWVSVKMHGGQKRALGIIYLSPSVYSFQIWFLLEHEDTFSQLRWNSASPSSDAVFTCLCNCACCHFWGLGTSYLGALI